MTLPPLLRLALLLAPLASAQGAEVVIPALTTGAGSVVEATLGIRLVDAAGQNVVAFNASGLATEYRDLALGAAGVTVSLAPQVALALPDGGATYYQIDAKWRGGVTRWRVQVADTPTPQPLRDLVGASAIEGEDLAAQLVGEVRDAALATAADRVQTGLDVQATGADAIATAADRVQTGLDVQATGADAIATAADRVQTGLDATATADDALATAFDRAAIEDWHLVHTLFWLSDDAQVYPDDVTLWSHGAGQLAGLVCRVVSPPLGGDITFDLLAGDPLVSAYGAGPTPTIVAGDTSTLAGHPEAVPNPITLAAGTPIRLRVLSAPDQNLDGNVPTVGDLPLSVPVGYRILVAADNHVWTRNAYDAVVWTDTGLPAGGEWLGAVATVAALPTATASANEVWLVTETARLWQMTNQVDGHAADQASLPAAASVASGAIYVTTDLSQAWQSGSVTWTLVGAAWSDRGQVYLPDITFTAIATSADLPTAALSGVWYLALDTGRLWRNDAPPWLDSGLLTLFAGAGLRCGLYIYPLPE